MGEPVFLDNNSLCEHNLKIVRSMFFVFVFYFLMAKLVFSNSSFGGFADMNFKRITLWLVRMSSIMTRTGLRLKCTVASSSGRGSEKPNMFQRRRNGNANTANLLLSVLKLILKLNLNQVYRAAEGRQSLVYVWIFFYLFIDLLIILFLRSWKSY